MRNSPEVSRSNPQPSTAVKSKPGDFSCEGNDKQNHSFMISQPGVNSRVSMAPLGKNVSNQPHKEPPFAEVLLFLTKSALLI